MVTPKPTDAYKPAQTPTHLSEFAGSLKTALNASLPSSGNYKRVSVLAFHWPNDQMGVVRLERRLLEILSQEYQYETESYPIPLAQSAPSLVKKLFTWSEQHCGPQTLRIYIYSGHAEGAGTTDTDWYLGGESNAHGNLVGSRLNWPAVNYAGENMAGEMCYIFDCCSAGSLAMRDGPEIIAAAGWEQSAGSRLLYSFTQALIDVLDDLKGEPETLAQIYSHIFRRAHQNQVSSCPIHVPKIGAGSVKIAPLHSDSASRRPMTRSRTRVEHRVLLSVLLHAELDAPELEQWKRWLATNIPPGVASADVRIESAFKGSGLILVSIPVEVWTMLSARDSSMKFVAHLPSSNVLPEVERRSQLSLPSRPPPSSDKENRPFSHQPRKSVG